MYADETPVELKEDMVTLNWSVALSLVRQGGYKYYSGLYLESVRNFRNNQQQRNNKNWPGIQYKKVVHQRNNCYPNRTITIK